MRQLFLIVMVLLLCPPFNLKAQTCGTTNIALGKSVVVSSEWAYRLGGGAVDGNATSNGWYTNNTNDTAYIYVDLGQSYNVCKIKLYWESDGRGKNYKLQTSTDAATWTDLASRTNNSGLTDSFSVTGNGRYVRLYMTAKVNTWATYQLGEIELYNSLSNYHPAVSLTAPVNNYKTVAGNNIKLTASAADSDGSISRVEFYQDAIKLGEATAAPYEFTWTNVQAGQYALRAKAYDNSNADSLSVAVNITVSTSNRWSITGNHGTNPDSNFVGTTDNRKLVFKTNGTKKMTILSSGFVGIGVDSIGDSSARLGVNGTIYARKLKINQSAWADDVFEKGYPLMPLATLEAYIQQHRHLPLVPTTVQVQKEGTDVADTQEQLLRKIEELTLYIIEQHKQLERQQRQIRQLQQNTRHR